jgi:uncharacterized protein
MDLTLVLTHDCNLGCSYCYAGRKFRKVMAPAIADAALDMAFASARPRADGGERLQIAYFGGEPTLEWDMLVTYATRARERAAAAGIELVQSVTTNGTLLTKERVALLGELGVYVALSIDGNRLAHEVNRPNMNGSSSWEAVSRALDLLAQSERPFETISVVTPASVVHFADSVAHLYERGVPRVSINPCYEAIWTDGHLAQWEEALEHSAGLLAGWMRLGRTVSFAPFDAKIIARIKGGLEQGDKCSLGESMVAVAPSGNLYSCERLVGEDEDTRHVIGHVTTGVSLEHRRAVRGAMPDWHATNDECGTCAERDRCGAYCACANLAETGSLGIAGGVQCWFERTTMRLADQLAERMIAEKNEPFLEWFYPGKRDASANYRSGRPAQQIPRPPGPSKDAPRHLRVLP